MSYHAAANKKEKDQDDTKPATWWQYQKANYRASKRIVWYQETIFRFGGYSQIHKRIWELLYCPIPSTQHLQDLERSFHEANKLVENIDDDNFYWCQHTALINLLIEANHARLVAETTADHWCQRFEKEKTSKTWT